MSQNARTAGSVAKRHRHEFTALWWHFGPYGRQDVHVHSCFTEGCDRVLIGETRECGGHEQSHHRETLTDAPVSGGPRGGVL